MYGEISFDRAANEIFEEKEEGSKAQEKLDEAKGMALLYRSGLKKTDDQKQDELITEEIQQYVQKLLQELPKLQT